MAEKELDFQTDFHLEQPCVVGDDVRIQQVMMNLLDNARKFTPSGGHVRFSVTQSRLADGGVLTRAEIADDGKGMSEAFQKQVFESFARETDAVSKGNEGTGLGLPISRQLAEMMGGELTFTSRKDAGSTFVFSFPGKPAEMLDRRQSASPAKPRVLVAEDNELNGEIMLELLESEGYQAELSRNGREALERFSRSAPNTFGVILMDLLMPEMDGFQAAAAIRALDRPDAGTVRIIACTANTMAEDREHAFACGMDGFLSKPVDVDELLRALAAS